MLSAVCPRIITPAPMLMATTMDRSVLVLRMVMDPAMITMITGPLPTARSAPPSR
jgi:hypothetical protein